MKNDLGFKGFSDDEIFEELRRRGITVSDDAGRRERYDKLFAAVKKVVTQRADDLCWRDVYTELAELVGVEFVPEMIDDTDKMLVNCQKFIKSLKCGGLYQPVFVERDDAKVVQARELAKKINDKYEARDRLWDRSVRGADEIAKLNDDVRAATLSIEISLNRLVMMLATVPTAPPTDDHPEPTAADAPEGMTPKEFVSATDPEVTFTREEIEGMPWGSVLPYVPAEPTAETRGDAGRELAISTLASRLAGAGEWWTYVQNAAQNRDAREFAECISGVVDIFPGVAGQDGLKEYPDCEPGSSVTCSRPDCRRCRQSLLAFARSKKKECAELLAKVAGVRAELEAEKRFAYEHVKISAGKYSLGRHDGSQRAFLILDAAFPSDPGEVKTGPQE